jgi:hypothetical protein
MFGAAERGDGAISLTLTCDPFSRLSCCAQQHAPRSTARAPRSTAHAPRSTAHAPRSTAHAPRSTAHAPRSKEITRRRSHGSVRGTTRSLRGLVQCAGAAWSMFRAAERSDRAISLTRTCDPFRGRDRQAARTSAVCRRCLVSVVDVEKRRDARLQVIGPDDATTRPHAGEVRQPACVCV